METNTPVWLHAPSTPYEWLPAKITKKEVVTIKNRDHWRLTLVNDDIADENGSTKRCNSFETVLTVDPSNLDHAEIKLRNNVSENVSDLITLPHLHEPAILHSLRLRYDGNVIYTSTGPILIAINPFKRMEGLYGEGVMEEYRRAGEGCRYVLLCMILSCSITPMG
jgi:myosin heavy subunit